MENPILISSLADQGAVGRDNKLDVRKDVFKLIANDALP